MATTTETGSTRRSAPRAGWGPVIFAAGLIGLGGIGLIVPQANRYWLDHHGTLARAQVVGVLTPSSEYYVPVAGGSDGGSDGEDGGEGDGGDGGGDGGDPTLDVSIPACACVAKVDVASDTHPIGSFVQVRYDPGDPTHAIAVEDPASPDLSGLAVIGFGIFYLFAARRKPRRTRR